MAILNIVTSQTGLVGVLPSLAYINTSDTEATVLVTGYLNHAVEQGFQFSIPCMACVSTRTSPNAVPDVGWYEIAHVGTNWSLIPTASPGAVVLPTIANHIATYTNTTGTLGEDPTTAITGGNLQAGLSGTAGYLASFPGTASKGSLRLVGAASAGDTITQITNASMAAARVFTIPDGGQAASNFIMSDSATTQTIATGSLALTLGNLTVAAGTIAASQGNISAGSSGHAGTFISFPATAANGTFIFSALNAGGAFNTTLRNSVMGQSSVISIPDPGAATANVLLDTGTAAAATITRILTGSAHTALIDYSSCTIAGVAGAANTCTVTIQVKDGAGNNIGRQVPFKVYSSSAADGLTLQSAASTGYSIASGGLSLANGTAITTQISGMTSATGGCVLSLLDTGKQTSYLVLVVEGGIKISAQLSAGSYG